MDKDKVNEEYSGGGYSLLLSYIKKIDQNGEPVYEGRLTLENKNINEAYNIIGYTCNL